MNLYEIEYRYLDDKEYHFANVVGYKTNTVAGDTLDKIMDKANEDGDCGGVEVYNELIDLLEKISKRGA